MQTVVNSHRLNYIGTNTKSTDIELSGCNTLHNHNTQKDTSTNIRLEMAPQTEAGWAVDVDRLARSSTKTKGASKSKSPTHKNGKKISPTKSKNILTSPPPPPEKDNDWWQNLKSQIRFLMTVQGKTNMLTDAENLHLSTDAENLHLSTDPDVFNEESVIQKKPSVRSLWSKLTPIIMKYTPQIFNIKPPKSPEKNVKDWLEAMPEPEKCKTDDNVDSLWWPTTEAKVTEIIEDASPAKSTYIPRKERKATGYVDPFLKMYSNTTQLVPFKECSRSLVDLRTLETKRRNRMKPKNRFCKNTKNAANKTPHNL